MSWWPPPPSCGRTAPFGSWSCPAPKIRSVRGAATGLDPMGYPVDPAAALARIRPPVVVAIAGRCESVGFELALAADIRLVSPAASFALADATNGRLPCWGGTQRFPGRSVRPAPWPWFCLVNSSMPHRGHRRAGLSGGRLAGRRRGRVGRPTPGAGPLALELAKEAVHRGAELPLRDGLRLEGDLNHLLQMTADRAEGLAAFFAKRPPDFAGR